MAINYTFTADNKEVMKAITEVTAKIDNLSRKMQAGGKTTDKYFQDLEKDAKGAAGGMKELLKQTAAFAGISLGAAGVAQFAKSIVNVRKEMQSLQVSFKTLLGSEEKATKMFGELKQLAATTPLMLKDLAAGAQTMLGFNIEAEKVVPTLKAIGDISMGDAQKFQSLTLAFSQMSATGKLMGQDHLQMINAGFNPLTEISRKTGKSIATLKEEMSAGSISAQMVADAFMSATSEGGKFNGMLEEQGKTLAGAMNQLQGAIDDMFNSIGEQTEGVIAGAVAATQKLVENYEKVGQVIVALIGTYGTYKAAQLTVMAVEKAHEISLMAERVGWQMTRLSILESIKAMKAYTVVAKAAPFALVAVLVAGVATAMWNLAKGTDAATAAQNKLSNARQKFKASIESDEKESERLIRIIQNQEASADEKAEAYIQLTKISNTFCKQYDQEAIAVMNLSEALEKVNAANKGRQGAFDTVQLKKLKETEKYLVSLKTYYDAKEGKGEVVRLKNVHDREIAEIEREKKEKIEQAKNVADAVARAEMEAQAEADAKMKAKKADEKYQKGVQAASTAPGTRSKNVSEILENAIIGKNDIEQWLRKIRDEKAKIESEIAEDNAAPSTTQAEKLYSEEAKRLMKDWKTAKKTYEALLKDKTATEKQVKSARSAVDAADTAYETLTGTKASSIEKQTKEQAKKLAKVQQDANFEARQARINEEEEGSDKAIHQLQLDFDKKKAEIMRQYDEEIELAEQMTDKKDKAEMKANAEALKEVRLTLAEQERDKDKTDVKEAEAKSMRDYLTEWGTMQEKRAAITEEYNERIRKATTEGEKKALLEEMKQALSNLDMSEFKDKINWEVIFGDLNSYTKKQLKDLKKRLQDFKKTDGYINASIEDKKAVDDALNTLSEEILNKGGIFGGLAQAFGDLAKAEQELTDATTAVNNTTEGTKEHEEAVRRQNQAQGNVTQAEGRVRTQAEKTRDSIAGLASQITALGTASEMTLTDLGSVASGIASAFGEAGQKAGGWIAAAFTVADMIAKDGLKGFAKNVADLFVDLGGGLLGYDQHSTTRYYEDQKKIHDNYINLLEDIISEQEELIKRQTGIEAINTYEDAIKRFEDIQTVRLEDIKNWLNAGSSAGSHSHGYKLKRSINSWDNEDIQALADILGVDTSTYLDINTLQDKTKGNFEGRMAELANVNVEQIKAIRDVATIWEKLPDEVRDYYQEILDAEKAMKDLEKTTNESLTQTTFDNVRSAFVNNLKSMKTSAQDWADSFEDMMRDAVINAMMVNNFDKAIQAWYDDFADKMSDEDGLTAAEKEVLQSSYDKIVDDATALRDNLYDTLGIDDRQSPSATQGIAASFSQDSIDEANGRMAALQMGQQQQITHLNTLVDLAGLRNSYIQDIYTRLGQMQSTIDARLKEISTNTSNL